VTRLVTARNYFWKKTRNISGWNFLNARKPSFFGLNLLWLAMDLYRDPGVYQGRLADIWVSGIRGSRINADVDSVPQGAIPGLAPFPVRKPFRIHAWGSCFKTSKKPKNVEFESASLESSKWLRLARSVLSCAIVYLSGDFRNASVFR
jgi:hypothetical protein